MALPTCKRVSMLWVVMWIFHPLWMKERPFWHGFQDMRVYKNIEFEKFFWIESQDPESQKFEE